MHILIYYRVGGQVFGLETSFFESETGRFGECAVRRRRVGRDDDDGEDGDAPARRDARLAGLHDGGSRADIARRLATLRRYVKHRTLGIEPRQVF